MRIAVVGGGPAGLYFAILAKRADPHEITVIERNPPDATYGWGVVFSEETLSELRDADYETFTMMDDALVRWRAIDIHYRDTLVRSTGHGFSAISRRRMLDLLQSRCRDLGVELRFNTEVTGPEELEGYDLVVGADGVRSTVRAWHAEAFRTTAQPHATRYAWFGTDLVFEVFTFIFRATEYGLFTVHAYPFDARTSTFIVECAEQTWRNAGLDTMSEDASLAFCQQLFADHLGAHRLLSNRSLWTSFVTLRNASWHVDRTVLVGDAAHTAHFSIGSGTKLAMEDAMALSKALVAHPKDVDAAFAEYESERQPVVERFQQAASDSAAYFESVWRYLDFPPEQFAFNLLTRSGRITHASLTLRDPAIVNRSDRTFAGTAQIVTPAPALAPVRVGGLVAPNRVAVAPPPLDLAEDGLVGHAHAQQLTAAAATGAGLVVTEMVAVSAHARVTSGSGGLYRDEHTRAWASIVEQVHDRGALVALRLGHAGRRGATRPRSAGLDRPLPADQAWPLLAPSPLAYTSHSPVPHPVDARRFTDVREDFCDAAARAAAAAVDVLLLDCSDGYLLASFLSPLTNERDDEYGGDLQQRARWPLEILGAVRAVWPTDRALGVRLLADDRHPRGLSADDGVALAQLFAQHGCAVVDVVSGHTVPSAGADYRRLFNVALSDRLRNEAGVTTLVSGAITTLDQINTVLGAGRADLCVLDPSRYRP